jgi:hypothetical protein
MAIASVREDEEEHFQDVLDWFCDIGSEHVWSAIVMGIFHGRLKIWAMSWFESMLESWDEEQWPDPVFELIISYRTQGKTLAEAIFAAAVDKALLRASSRSSVPDPEDVEACLQPDLAEEIKAKLEAIWRQSPEAA